MRSLFDNGKRLKQNEGIVPWGAREYAFRLAGERAPTIHEPPVFEQRNLENFPIRQLLTQGDEENDMSKTWIERIVSQQRDCYCATHFKLS